MKDKVVGETVLVMELLSKLRYTKCLLAETFFLWEGLVGAIIRLGERATC